jgi:hypothetical protein
MSLILRLADKVGVLRVAEAVRHANRYCAFDAHAVARIVTGRTRTRPGPRPPPPLVARPGRRVPQGGGLLPAQRAGLPVWRDQGTLPTWLGNGRGHFHPHDGVDLNRRLQVVNHVLS